ncbi:THO complex subunit 7 [Planoprotostelium fungivorum]|uniref:THO complex subunit 7 n=1 Tax=Planoprotostelium fungivorum TaxID=1890364 RepID=A0A2P6N2Y1_9EUKA|nr:THO complex subunit 7 [Planoprotostelium fungivorum]
METESADDFLRKKAAIKEASLRQLAKSFFHFQNALSRDTSVDQLTQLYESTLLRDLQIFESSVQKTKSTLEMLGRQEQEDRDLIQSKSSTIESLKRNIGELQGVLAREEESVKHKEEYEQLCTTIETLPSRQVTEKNNQDMEEQIQRMMQEGEMLEEKISLQKKQFHLFLYSLDLLCGPQTEDKQNCNSAEIQPVDNWKREVFSPENDGGPPTEQEED